MLGQNLGRYRIVEKIGAGGMGEVYRAHDPTLGRDIALKVLPAADLKDASGRMRLMREARSAAALNHPNICTIHEVGEADGQAYIAMEYVRGAALADMLGGGLPPEQVTRLGAQLAEALAHAHEHGVLHRDLKSANVVITPEGRTKILDFGLAKQLGGNHPEDVTRSMATLTTPGAVVGTLAYLAPEQLRGKPADARSDIWALGVVLYEMAAGARPFRGQTGFELSSGILHQRPARLPGKIAIELRVVIERCLEKDPDARYQSADDVRAALEAVGTGATPSLAAMRHSLKRRPWVFATAAVMALLAAIIALDVGEVRSRWFGSRSAPAQVTSLAVLPLANLSGDDAQEFFADGMTDSLITELARVGGLKRVIARGSVMQFKKTDKPLAEIARELGVERLITGAVQRSGARVSITAQLIEPATGSQLWANRYDRELRDVLTLQNEIVSDIIGQVKVQLTPRERAQLSSAARVNPEAYEAVLKGVLHVQKLTPADFDLGMQYCQQALKLDPNYAPAYVCLSSALGGPAHMGLVPPLEVAEKAGAAARRAAELDPGLQEAHARVGSWTFLFGWDWQTAKAEFQKAGDATWGNVVYADFLLLMDRRDEALAVLRRALDRDPLNSWVQVAVGGRMLRLGRYDEGIALLQKVLKLEPNMGLAHRYLWTAYHNQGKLEAAIHEAKTFITLLGHPDVAEAMRGNYPESMKIAARLLAEKSRKKYIQPSEIARLHLYAGDREQAFAWLERAYETRDSWMAFINSDPRFDSLHSDPRFENILRRMNIPGPTRGASDAKGI